MTISGFIYSKIINIL